MDAFKTAEVKRMQLGGNKPWRDFFNSHQSSKLLGRDFDGCTIAERYDSEAGEEWKDRLTAKVEGTEYVPGTSKPATSRARKVEVGEMAGNAAVTPAGSGRNTPLQNVRSPPQRTASPSQKARNEAFFASKGSENASRPEDLPPSQGGKYAGFGSAPPPASNSPGSGSSILPTGDDFQRDPVAALTKGFGWLSSTVTKQAASVNTAYIQPGVKSLSEADFASQARTIGLQAGNFVQQGAKTAGDQFNRFVDPETSSQQPAMSGQRTQQRGAVAPEKKDFWDAFGQDPAGPPKEKKDFWDDFAAAGDVATQASAKPTSIGTSAMKTGGGAGGAGGAAGKKDEDTWGEW